MKIDILKLKQLDFLSGKDYLSSNGYIEYERIIDKHVESCDYIIDIFYINNDDNHIVSYTAWYDNIDYKPILEYWAEA